MATAGRRPRRIGHNAEQKDASIVRPHSTRDEFGDVGRERAQSYICAVESGEPGVESIGKRGRSALSESVTACGAVRAAQGR